jgi:hypothetical protein
MLRDSPARLVSSSPPSLPPPLWSFACHRTSRGLLSSPEPHRPRQYRPLAVRLCIASCTSPPFYPLPPAGPTVITAAQAYALWDVRPTLPYPHAPAPGPLPSAARTLPHMSDPPPPLCALPHPTLCGDAVSLRSTALRRGWCKGTLDLRSNRDLALVPTLAHQQSLGHIASGHPSPPDRLGAP